MNPKTLLQLFSVTLGALLALNVASAAPNNASSTRIPSRSTPAQPRASTPIPKMTSARLRARDLHVAVTVARNQSVLTVSALVLNTGNGEARDLRVFAAVGSQLFMPLRGPSRLLPGARAAFFATGRYPLRTGIPVVIRSFCRTCSP
jgi:hypothetical protein